MVPPVAPPFWHPAFSKGFILDWDGVLADTKLNFKPLREKYFDGRFVPLFEAMKTLPPSLGKELEKDIYQVEMTGAEEAEAVEGAFELLEWLESKAIPWCVVSRNCLDSILLAAKKTGLPLPKIVRSRDEAPVKPDPEALWAAAESMGVDGKDCVMVGDFVYDLVGARRAGMRAVLVQRPEAEWKHWADVDYDKLTEFLASLKAPEPLVPWEYATVAAGEGIEALTAAAASGIIVPVTDPFVLGGVIERAGKGTIFFRLDDPSATLTPEQWKNFPGLSPTWLDTPLSSVIEFLLQCRYPLAELVFPDDEGE